ncbi:MAG: hypothetical protein ACO4AL_11850 [Steroidobacteraceae bacterium]
MTLARHPDLEPAIDTTAITLAHHDPIEAAICPVPRAETFFFGINQHGQIYAYGDSPEAPARVLQEAEGLRFGGVLECRISPRNTRLGERDYLDLRLLAPLPSITWVLSLPCHGSVKADGSISTQWSVRSLLGALVSESTTTLDLRATAGILTARRGTGGASGFPANFIDLHLDTGVGPDGDYEIIYAKAIEGDRNSLEISVNQVRRALGLEPQFL